MAKRSAWRSSGTASRIIQRQSLLITQGGRCAYCGRALGPSEATVDHVWPRSGEFSIPEDANVVLACQRCNQAKGNSPPEEFVRDCPSEALIFRLYPKLRQN